MADTAGSARPLCEVKAANRQRDYVVACLCRDLWSPRRYRRMGMGHTRVDRHLYRGRRLSVVVSAAIGATLSRRA
jgi:hypothetical protein